MLRFIRQIQIEKSVRDTAVTRHVIERAAAARIPIDYIDDARPIIRQYEQTASAPAATSSSSSSSIAAKRTLLLTDFRGEAIKPCPGTLNYLCCRYEILNFAQGCPMDCSYCVLQGYFDAPLLTLQANSEAFLAAAARRLAQEPDRFFRLGTGEFADSLALDPLTGYARRLVEFIRDKPNALLELKSKAAHVDDLIGLDHGGRVICAWSLNAREIIDQEEYRVATLDERLEAAVRCRDAGYRLAFHFDPILHYDGWRDGYRHAIESIFAAGVRPEDIAWISLGCFRYKPGLDAAIRQRFPRSRFPHGEFILGGDKKMRYPQPLRVHIYKKIVEIIRNVAGSKVLLYFCMENPYVWSRVFGRAPRDNIELGKWLDEA